MLKTVCKLLLIITFLGIWIWGIVIEPYCLLDIDKRKVELETWDSNLNGFKIAVIGDFHASAGAFEMARIQRAVEETNAQKPDVILIIGDFVNGKFYSTNADVKTYSKVLSKLSAPYGVYGIFGNHDAKLGIKAVMEIIKRTNIKMLSDSGVEISTPKGKFYIAGLSDYYSDNYSYGKAFRNTTKGFPIILMAHSPSLFYEIPKEATLTVVGHTHGGQIRLPYIGAVFSNSAMGREFSDGLITKNGKTIYITRGLGTSRVPVRFFCPPQISILELYKK